MLDKQHAIEHFEDLRVILRGIQRKDDPPLPLERPDLSLKTIKTVLESARENCPEAAELITLLLHQQALDSWSLVAMLDI